MPTGNQASIRLFRIAGVEVFLHWSWFVIAVFEISSRAGRYSSISWNILEYVALFVIVLMHEYGHALACRSVGGKADRIVLWPLGGVAYVDPPQRPGATLWSLAAGPLVNVVLLPVLYVAMMVSIMFHWAQSRPNLNEFILAVFFIDMGLLLFNLLPIYPLDGGQMLRSVLWYFMGRARSLMVATVIGFIGVAVFGIYAIRSGSTWLVILAIFIVINCWSGFKHSIALLRLAKIPRRQGLACPWCYASPPLGNFWACGECQTRFDLFASHGACPSCTSPVAFTRCLDWGHPNPVGDWGITLVRIEQNA